MPPVCTPLTPELEVDARSLERLVNSLLSGGVHGLFALGSSGEAAFLTDSQREQVLDVVVSTVSGQVPVLSGAIDMTTPRVLERARRGLPSGGGRPASLVPRRSSLPFRARSGRRPLGSRPPRGLVRRAPSSPLFRVLARPPGPFRHAEPSSSGDEGIRGVATDPLAVTGRLAVIRHTRA